MFALFATGVLLSYRTEEALGATTRSQVYCRQRFRAHQTSSLILTLYVPLVQLRTTPSGEEAYNNSVQIQVFVMCYCVFILKPISADFQSALISAKCV